MLCLHQGIVESHLAVLGRKFAGNEKALQQLYFQDLREERWERECVELYLSHCYDSRESRCSISDLAVAHITALVESHVDTTGRRRPSVYREN
jgi:hypothetical protein